MMFRTEEERPCAHRLHDYASVIDVAICFAFQPLVEPESGETLGHEALVRGCDGESAAQIIASVQDDNHFYFDQACRMRAIRDADRLELEGDLHLNCSRIAPDNLRQALAWTAEAVDETGIDPDRIVLEFTTMERLGNPRQLAEVRRLANQYGFRIAADNFGTGEAGLKRLAVLQPEFVKLDRELVAGIHNSRRRKAMVLGILATCKALEIVPIATGVEEWAEIEWLKEAGVERFQGYYFARPEVDEQPHVPAGLLRESEFTACAA